MLQNLTRIDQAVADGGLAANIPLTALLDACAWDGRALHLVDLVSDGGGTSSRAGRTS